MKAVLGVHTCDKCGRPMGTDEPVLIIAEGNIVAANEPLTFTGTSVRYACHIDCWDGTEAEDTDNHRPILE